MVRHIVSWNFKDNLSEKDNREHAQKMKTDLEKLVNHIQGIVSMDVIINPLTGSTPDVILNSLFEDEDALKNYQVHEEHVKVAKFIGSVMQNRYCIDYIEK